MPNGFDPYYEWLGIPPKEQPPHHYRLLGIQLFESHPNVIQKAVDRHVIFLKTLQNGPRSALSQELINRITAASICLLSPDKKAVYDAQLVEALKSPSAPSPIPSEQVSIVDSPSSPKNSRSASRRQIVTERPVTAIVKIILGGVAGVGLATLALFYFAGIDPLGWSKSSRDKLAKGAAKEGGSQSQKPSRQAANSRDPKADGTGMEDPWKDVNVDSTGHGELSQTRIASEKRERTLQPLDQGGNTPGEPRQLSPGSKHDDDSAVSANKSDATLSPASPDLATPAKGSSTIPMSVTPAATESIESATNARVAPPDAAALKVAQEKVRQVFAEDFDGTQTPDRKKELALRLMEMARDIRETSAVRYALLGEAKTIALEVGDMKLALEVIDQLSLSFDVDVWMIKGGMLATVGKASHSVEQKMEVVQSSLKVLDGMVVAGRLDLADELVTAVVPAANGSRDPMLRSTFEETRKRIAAWKKSWEAANAAADRLRTDPTSPHDNLLLGQFRCLVQRDWEQGLPLLAQGEGPFAAAATADLRQPHSALDQVQVADAWWDAAAKFDGHEKSMIIARAGEWYARAARNLTGVEKSRVDRRLEEIAAMEQSARRAYTSIVPNEFGLAFDGDDHVAIDLRYDGSTPLTIEAYVTPRTGPGYNTIAGNIQISGVGLAVNNRKWVMYFHDAKSYKVASSDAPAEYGKLCHVAGVWDGRMVRLYVDGKLQSAQPVTNGKHKASKFPFYLGADPSRSGTPEQHFTGALHQVRISRVARYTKDFVPDARFAADKQTVSLWRIDEGSGSRLADASGNGIDGAIVGAKWLDRP
ncbi:MAG TPA: LamG-like jellyroll fold domain-containing protein [Pirellulaceae bacterium]|nr:LamG-like jellyroll fold domain-containing protein [Pirellulaceae bacterium]